MARMADWSIGRLLRDSAGLSLEVSLNNALDDSGVSVGVEDEFGQGVGDSAAELEAHVS